MSAADKAGVERAVGAASKRKPMDDPLAFHFMRDAWIGLSRRARAADMRRWADEWACKLQQYTGAIMAKSMEDTFFYRYVRPSGANELARRHPADLGCRSTHSTRRIAEAQTFPACMLTPPRTRRS